MRAERPDRAALTLRDLRDQLVRRLREGGLDDPDGEADALLADLADITLTDRLCRGDRRVPAATADRLFEAATRRLAGEPLASIAGFVDFYGRRLIVTRDTLCPRGDTERLIEAVLRHLPAKTEGALRLLDTCCGGGCVGLVLADELISQGVPVALTLADLSPAALDVARLNAARFPAVLTPRFARADLWPESAARYDLITCNPPYIPTGDLADLMLEVRNHDPRLALDGGADGLDFYRRLAREAPHRLAPGGRLGLEHGFDQREAVARIMRTTGFRILEGFDDYGGRHRGLILAR